MSLSRAIVPPGHPIDPPSASRLLANWGFLAEPDLPDRPGPAWLLVAIRPVPTLRHFDPELVEYWVSEKGRGRHATITYETPMPLNRPFSWGLIRVVDRLKVSNEYLTFGGNLAADTVEDAVVAAFTSPAPLLRRGGHSQVWDPPAEWLGAFFGRLLVAVDYEPGFEALVAAAEPLARYAAFVADCRPVTGRASSGAWTNPPCGHSRRPRNVGSGASILKRGWRVTSCWPRAAWLHDLWPVQSGPSHPLATPFPGARVIGDQ